MGSWYETCMASSLPIVHGERVVWLVIARNPYDQGVRGTYPSDGWFPCSLPLRGEYDDYGLFVADAEKSPDSLKQIETALCYVRQKIVPKEQNDRDKTCEIPAICPEEFNLDNLQRWLRECYVKIDRNNGLGEPIVPATSVFIREDVWDHFMQHKVEWGFEEEDRYLTLDRLIQEACKWCQIMNSLPEDDQLSTKADRFSTMFHLETNNIFGMSIRSRESSLHTGNLYRMLLDPLKDDLALLRTVCEQLFVEYVFRELRLSWYPTSGKGSQGDEFTKMKEFYLKMAELAAEQEHCYECGKCQRDNKDTPWELLKQENGNLVCSPCLMEGRGDSA